MHGLPYNGRNIEKTNVPGEEPQTYNKSTSQIVDEGHFSRVSTLFSGGTPWDRVDLSLLANCTRGADIYRIYIASCMRGAEIQGIYLANGMNGVNIYRIYIANCTRGVEISKNHLAKGMRGVDVV